MKGRDFELKELFTIFAVFAKIGAVTFGGGYAMLPILQREIVAQRSWVSSEEMLDYFAVGQCTPGVIAVNTAAYIGYKLKGIRGAVFATLGVAAPSIVIILMIAPWIDSIVNLEIMQHAMAGVRICVCMLIVATVADLIKKSLTDIWTVAVYIILLLLAVFTKISVIILILAAGALGFILSFRKMVRK